jgi:hypothetical protein
VLVDRGREAGFDHYVAKFDRDGLLKLLREPRTKWARAA